MIGIGIGLPFIKAGGNSAEALAWKSYIEGNGGTISQALLDTFDTNFFIPAKANGNILTELDRLNIYCGLVGYEIAARTNLIKNAHYVTPVSSPTFDNNGYKSSGTSYLNLNYNPNTQGVKLVQNSVAIGYVVSNPLYASLIRGLGCISTSLLLTSEIISNVRIFANTGTGSNSIALPASRAYLGTIRQDLANQKAQIDATITSFAVASTGVPNLDMYELTQNNAGTPAGNYDTNYHLASWCGSGSLDVVNLRTILQGLFTALGV